jgi:hypothetical protein
VSCTAPLVVYPPQPRLASRSSDVDDNTRTTYILVALFVIMGVAFVASIYGIAFYEGW